MYHTIMPVSGSYDPIVVEGAIETQIIIFNAGPGAVEVQVWRQWKGKVNDEYQNDADQPNLRLELRAGDQRIVSGAFIRLKIKNTNRANQTNGGFAAVGVCVINNSNRV